MRKLRQINNIDDLKEMFQAGFDKNEDSLEAFGKTYTTQLKSYLIETNHSSIGSIDCPLGMRRISAESCY